LDNQLVLSGNLIELDALDGGSQAWNAGESHRLPGRQEPREQTAGIARNQH
jgi:hypothetical protein